MSISPAIRAVRTILVLPSSTLLTTSRPLLRSKSTIILPKRAPSVSIFEPTVTFSAAYEGAAKIADEREAARKTAPAICLRVNDMVISRDYRPNPGRACVAAPSRSASRMNSMVLRPQLIERTADLDRAGQGMPDDVLGELGRLDQ